MSTPPMPVRHAHKPINLSKFATVFALTFRPINRMLFEWIVANQENRRGGRESENGWSGGKWVAAPLGARAAMALMVTPVAAAASVPSSLTSI
jgi:hypothetical protein